MASTYCIDYIKNHSVFENYSNATNIPVDCSTIVINNCPLTTDFLKFIFGSWFEKIVTEKCPTLLAMRLKVPSNFKSSALGYKTQFDFASFFKEKEQKVDNLSLRLLTFESSDSSKIMVIWKNNSCSQYLKFLMTDDKTTATLKLFTLNYIIDALKAGYQVNLSTGYANDLVCLNSSYCRNVLLYAIIKGNLEVVQELLKLPFNVNKTMWDGTYINKNQKKLLTMIDYAQGDMKNEIILELLKANSVFPENFENSHDISEFIKINEDMHTAIKNNNRAKVIEIIDENQGLKYYFNRQNISAFNYAFKTQRKEIYEFFLERGITYSPNEDINIYHDEKLKSTLCSLYSKFAHKVPKYHLKIFLLRSVIIKHSDKELNQHIEQIKIAFETINRIPEINLQFKINVTCPKFRIHFDFIQNRVNYLGSNNHQGFAGLFHSHTHHIEIAAKSLLENKRKEYTNETIAHESGHFTMHLIFRNERMPFSIDDEVNREKFLKIVEECKKVKDLEPVIQGAFSKFYERNDPVEDIMVKCKELIVRVPQLLAFYQYSQTKLSEVKKIFKSLFDYYDQVVLPEMRLALPVLQKLGDESIDIKFGELTKPLKAAILHKLAIFQGQMIKFKEFADENSLNHLTPKQIRNMLDGKLEHVGKQPEIVNKFDIERDFISSNFKEAIFKDCSSVSDFNSYQQATANFVVKAAMRTVDLIMPEMDISKLLILSNQQMLTGVGKSTILKYLSSQMKKNEPNKYVCYIDLKQHLKIYEKYHNQIIEKSSTESATQVKKAIDILLDILTPKTQFECAVFEHLFKSNQVILLFDNLDEILSPYKDFFSDLIENIKFLTDNRQLIPMKPQYIEELETKLKYKSIKLIPFDSTDCEEFTREYLQLRRSIDNQTKVNEIMKIIEGLEIVDNTLMLKIIIELYLQGRVSKDNLNKFELYREIADLKFKDFTNKKEKMLNEEDSKLTILEVHQVYALQSIFKCEKFKKYLTSEEMKLLNIKEFSLIKKWSKQKKNWKPEAISRHGYLTIDNWNTDEEQPKFIHKSFLEYFLTQFIIDVVNEILSSETNLTTELLDLTMKFAVYIVDNFNEFNFGTHIEDVWNFIIIYNSTKNSQNSLSELKVFGGNIKKYFKENIRAFSHIFDIELFVEPNELLNPNFSKIRNIKLFYKMVTRYLTDKDSNWLREFLLTKCKPNQIHPLIIGINFDITEVTDIYQIAFSFEEILKILFCCINYICFFARINPRKFSIFFSHLKCGSIEQQFKNDIAACSSNFFDINFHNRFEVYFNFFNAIACSENLQTELECFLKESLYDILWYAFHSQLFTEKLFEILVRHFNNDKSKVVELIRTAIDKTSYFNINDICNEHIRIEFKSVMQFFWFKVDEFCDSDRELMRKIFFGEYAYNHPLILGIYYYIENLIDFYFKYFDFKEVLIIFIRSLDLVARFYKDEYFERFVEDKILSNNEGQIALKRLNRSTQFLNDVFKIKRFNSIDDFYVSKETKQINIEKCQNLMFHILNRLKSNYFESLSLNVNKEQTPNIFCDENSKIGKKRKNNSPDNDNNNIKRIK